MHRTRRQLSLAACPRCGQPARRVEQISTDDGPRDSRWIHDDGSPECDSTPRGGQFRASAVEEEDAAPGLVISCGRCGGEETVNDEDGCCPLDHLNGWAREHACQSGQARTLPAHDGRTP